MLEKPTISVCIPCQNRSRVPSSAGTLELFPECVRSIRQSAIESGIHVELVVADYKSTDWPLAEWLPAAFEPFDVTIVHTNRVFSLGGGKNIAAEHASSDVLFFCETDMLVPPRVLVGGLNSTDRGEAYFPLYQRYTGPDRQHSYWGTGHGVCVVKREHWEEHPWLAVIGWGSGEDDAFAHWFTQRGLSAREQVAGFYHLWHPLVERKKELDRQAIAEGRLDDVKELAE